MTIKEQILSTAFDLFSEQGIKSVSMDDIAHSTSVSKRTLYELFEDKETLLTACINQSYTKMKSFIKQLESEPITALDVALLFYEELMKRPRWFNRKFYDDLKRYPKAWQKTEEEKSRFLKKCTQLLVRGAKEGVFLSNINVEIVALLAKELAQMIRPSNALSNHSASEVFNTILYSFLRGISTEKGIAILDRYLLKYTQKLLD
ncbi:MAG: TetR/AcrR family transcriptional regulator [Parabacteroides sp.]|nr:TetR/AcrR family transcriptional regulator [Parabacteroides sp.]